MSHCFVYLGSEDCGKRAHNSKKISHKKAQEAHKVIYCALLNCFCAFCAFSWLCWLCFGNEFAGQVAQDRGNVFALLWGPLGPQLREMFAARGDKAIVDVAARLVKSIHITLRSWCDQRFIEKLSLRALELVRISFSFAAELLNGHVRLTFDLDQQPRRFRTHIDSSTRHYRGDVLTPHVTICEYRESTQ